MSTRVDNQGESVQGTVLKSQAEELGLQELWEDVVEETSESNRDDVAEQFQIYTTSLAVQDTLEQAEMTPIEIGGGAVFNYVLSEEGAEAFEQWRGTGDSDKYIAARGEDGSRRDIPELIESSYGSRKGKTVTDTGNAFHDGEKYTIRLEAEQGQEVELDLMRPDSAEDEDYNVENTERLNVANTSITVPQLDELMMAKLESYVSSDRDKDRSDIGNLLHVQEQRYNRGETDIDAQDLYEISQENGMGEEYLNVLDEIEDNIPFTSSAGNYSPSKSFLQF